MRCVRIWVAAVVASASSGCGAGVAPSNGAKVGEAVAFAAVAGAAQVAQSIAEERARSSAPIARSGGYGLSPCDNQGQYACLSVAAAPAPPPERAPEPEMTADEARDYVRDYVNGVRKLNGAPPVVRDESLDAFAEAGSEELARDHQVGRHLADRGREIGSPVGEVQSAAEGAPSGMLQDQIGATLLEMTGEGSGGPHHDVILRPGWRKLGVGIVNRAGRAYLTVDFSN
jgi:uncharacterized protein YkwD